MRELEDYIINSIVSQLLYPHQTVSAETAIAIGKELLLLKRKVKETRGVGWGPFMKKYFGVSIRTCQNYMKLAKTQIHPSNYCFGTEIILAKIRKGENLSIHNPVPVTEIINSKSASIKTKDNKMRKYKKRPQMRLVCDHINQQKPGRSFTFSEFMDTFNVGGKKHLTIKNSSIRQCINGALREGYLTCEQVLGKRQRAYTKLHDIPEDQMFKVMTYDGKGGIHMKKTIKKIPISSVSHTPNLPDGYTVIVEYNTVKEMESLLVQQNQKIIDLKMELAELIDENKSLITKIKTVEERKNIPAQYRINTEQFKQTLL